MAVIDELCIFDIGADLKAQIPLVQHPHIILAALLKGGQQEAGIHDLPADDLVLKDAQELHAEALHEHNELPLEVAVCCCAEPLEEPAEIGGLQADEIAHSALCSPVRCSCTAI